MEFKIENGDGFTKIRITEDFMDTASATCFYSRTPEVDGKHIGASAVQGRQVYGSKISRSKTVFVKKHA